MPPPHEAVAQWADAVWDKATTEMLTPNHKSLRDLVLTTMDNTITDLEAWMAQLGSQGSPTTVV